MTVTPGPPRRSGCATKYAVEEESRNTVSRGASIATAASRERPLGLRRGLHTRGERVLLGRDGGEHRPAVRAAGDALALELGEVAPRGHRRDAEALLDLAHGDRARAAHRSAIAARRDSASTGRSGVALCSI